MEFVQMSLKTYDTLKYNNEYLKEKEENTDD